MPLSPIIETNELLKIFNNPDVLIFDVSTGKNAHANYELEHIAGAYFVDLNTQLADIKSDFADGGRHPLPTVTAFAKTLTELGISKNHHLIIYDDNNASNAAARFWWMLKSAGHEKVQVLNGGINQAKKNNFPISSKTEIIKPATEPYLFTEWTLPTIEMYTVEMVSQNPDYLVIDVRSKERYDGKFEPIDLIAGHIPGAVNMPFTENTDAQGLFLDPSVLRNKYESLFNQTKSENIIVHCGSGVTACHTLLALAYAGMEIPNLYVGSWSEWSRNGKTIVTTEG